MEVTREDVLRCAALAHLSLREEEIEPMRLAMAQMLNHATSLDELSLEEVEPLLLGHGQPLLRTGATSWSRRCCRSGPGGRNRPPGRSG